MIEAKPFPDEAKRLEALQALHLLDTPIEERFERITRMVRDLLDVPIVLFNLIDEKRQHYKSAIGLDNTDAALEAAFCTHALHEADILLVPDARLDQRFADNPFVTGKYLNLNFYAGCPVRTADGMPVGTLCAIDTKPRDISPEKLSALRDLADLVEKELKQTPLSEAQIALMKEISETRQQALVDPLTRLWNGEGMNTLLETEWREAARYKKTITIIMADIDDFVKVNDTFGRPLGDSALKVVAKKLLEVLRGEETIGRLKEDEFMLILSDAGPDKVKDIISRIRAGLSREPLSIGQSKYGETTVVHKYPITLSFGAVTASPTAATQSTDMIEKATRCLQRAKGSGSDKSVIIV